MGVGFSTKGETTRGRKREREREKERKREIERTRERDKDPLIKYSPCVFFSN